LDEKVKDNLRLVFQGLRAKMINRQSAARAFEVGEKHYDLGNELYLAMLDKRLTYSCAYWKNACNQQLWQIVFTHQGTLQSNCRYS
jgi:cyclopropane-fatty-acyl-phospholipid synthase